MEKNNIYLIGLSGTGKSTVGKELAKITNLSFFEMDHEITKIEGYSISEIFKIKGEEHFRNVESDVLFEISKNKGYIISTGGGVPIKKYNRELMNKSGLTVKLDCNPDVIFNRIKSNQKSIRPLLGSAITLNKIKTMYFERESIYSFAHHTIDTSKRIPSEIANSIVDFWIKWMKTNE